MDYLLDRKPVCTSSSCTLRLRDLSELSQSVWVCECVSSPMPVLWLRQQVPFSPRQPAGSRVRSHCCSARLWEPSRYLAWTKRVNYRSGGNSRQLGTSRGWWDRMGIGCVSIAVHESWSYSRGIMPDYGAKQGALSVSRLVLGEDSGRTGPTAAPGCSAARHSGVQ